MKRTWIILFVILLFSGCGFKKGKREEAKESKTESKYSYHIKEVVSDKVLCDTARQTFKTLAGQCLGLQDHTKNKYCNEKSRSELFIRLNCSGSFKYESGDQKRDREIIADRVGDFKVREMQLSDTIHETPISANVYAGQALNTTHFIKINCAHGIDDVMDSYNNKISTGIYLLDKSQLILDRGDKLKYPDTKKYLDKKAKALVVCDARKQILNLPHISKDKYNTVSLNTNDIVAGLIKENSIIKEKYFNLKIICLSKDNGTKNRRGTIRLEAGSVLMFCTVRDVKISQKGKVSIKEIKPLFVECLNNEVKIKVKIVSR